MCYSHSQIDFCLDYYDVFAYLLHYCKRLTVSQKHYMIRPVDLNDFEFPRKRNFKNLRLR